MALLVLYRQILDRGITVRPSLSFTFLFYRLPGDVEVAEVVYLVEISLHMLLEAGVSICDLQLSIRSTKSLGLPTPSMSYHCATDPWSI